MKINKKFYFVMFIMGIIGLFFTTYYFVSESIENRNLNNQFESTAEETVANQGERALREDLKVSFYTGETRDKTTTVSELLKELNIEKNLTEEILSKAVLSDGYKLANKSDDTFVYKREKEDSLKPNTYYIGESDGYLAIYKTDDKGTIKKEKVYSEDTPIDMLRDIDVNKLKNYKYFNSTKLEDVENKITELIT